MPAYESTVFTIFNTVRCTRTPGYRLVYYIANARTPHRVSETTTEQTIDELKTTSIDEFKTVGIRCSLETTKWKDAATGLVLAAPAE